MVLTPSRDLLQGLVSRRTSVETECIRQLHAKTRPHKPLQIGTNRACRVRQQVEAFNSACQLLSPLSHEGKPVRVFLHRTQVEDGPEIWCERWRVVER